MPSDELQELVDSKKSQAKEQLASLPLKMQERIKSELGAWAEEVVSNQLPLPEEQLREMVRSWHENAHKCIKQEHHLGREHLTNITDAIAAHMGQVAADLQKKNQAMHDKQAFRAGLWNFASNVLQVGLQALSDKPIEEPVVPIGGGRRWPALTTKDKDCILCEKKGRGNFCHYHNK